MSTSAGNTLRSVILKEPRSEWIWVFVQIALATAALLVFVFSRIDTATVEFWALALTWGVAIIVWSVVLSRNAADQKVLSKVLLDLEAAVIEFEAAADEYASIVGSAAYDKCQSNLGGGERELAKALSACMDSDFTLADRMLADLDRHLEEKNIRAAAAQCSMTEALLSERSCTLAEVSSRLKAAISSSS
jgi:hypothetical protein